MFCIMRQCPSGESISRHDVFLSNMSVLGSSSQVHVSYQTSSNKSTPNIYQGRDVLKKNKDHTFFFLWDMILQYIILFLDTSISNKFFCLYFMTGLFSYFCIAPLSSLWQYLSLSFCILKSFPSSTCWNNQASETHPRTSVWLWHDNVFKDKTHCVCHLFLSLYQTSILWLICLETVSCLTSYPVMAMRCMESLTALRMPKMEVRASCRSAAPSQPLLYFSISCHTKITRTLWIKKITQKTPVQLQIRF